MFRSMRLRLILAFVVVVGVAVGVAEIIAERTARNEFEAYVSRVDAAYLETLAGKLGDYYAANGSWREVESVFETLPQAPGRLQLLDSSGNVVGDSSPGRGPGPGGSPGGPSDGGPGQGGGDASATPTPAATGSAPDGPQGGPGQSGGGDVATPGPAATDSPSGGPGGVPGGAISTLGPRGPNNAPQGGEQGGQNDLAVAQIAGGPRLLIASSGIAAEATPTPQSVQRIPVYANGQQVGTLVVVSGTGAAAQSTFGDRFFDRVRLGLIVGGGAALLLAIILAVVLVDGVTRPLRRLAEGVRRIAAGDFSERVAVTSPSEAAELARSFNRMAESLEQDRETRHRLLSDIVHELRTPLSVIQGTAQGFLDGVIPADTEHASLIRDEASLLSKLVTDLRDIALAEAGELRLEQEPQNMSDLARQAVAAASVRAGEKGVSLEFQTPSDAMPVTVDRDRTLQVLGNLVDNALRHTPAGGKVTVSVRGPLDGGVAVDVTDTGEGIAPEHLPHVFERFYRIDPARSPGGTGLGLAIAKQLTEAQGGTLSAKSEPGRGSSFTVALPLAPLGAGM